MSTISTESILVTADELGSMLKISTRTLWRMRSAGKLPQPIRVGGSIRWRASDIEAWVTAGCPADTAKRTGKTKS